MKILAERSAFAKLKNRESNKKTLRSLRLKPKVEFAKISSYLECLLLQKSKIGRQKK
ncbi:hypothetical protein [Epilithonimonas sp.]|uniref:hypothetical protein n=1 Tax=Epilithonimonas sp. TaxID=2894511 RepID=UPI0028990908|nr:hypothetical protein [Epilithonimonas sp.]